jgi:hypothetical protein
MINTTFIIPLHKYDEEVEKLLKEALKSLQVQARGDDKIIFVGPEEPVKKGAALYDALLSELNEKGVKVIEVVNNGKTDFASQINLASSFVTTPYFSILEYDDVYEDFWRKVMEEYLEYKASVTIPLNVCMKDGKGSRLANEIAISPIFKSSENDSPFANVGDITLDNLSSYNEFSLTGSLFKTEDFISVGGLKSSMKSALWYEFMLRMAYNNYKLFAIPKLAYFHTIEREGSFMDELSKISADEHQWLLSTARNEYFFKEDRNREYTPEVKEEPKAETKTNTKKNKKK